MQPNRGGGCTRFAKVSPRGTVGEMLGVTVTAICNFGGAAALSVSEGARHSSVGDGGGL
jgi:hypothetical protein